MKRLRCESSNEVLTDRAQPGNRNYALSKGALKSTDILMDSSEKREQIQKERSSEITAYVDPKTPGFSGILKKRFLRIQFR